MDTCNWPLGNGESLSCEIYDPSITTWNKVPGIYIFAKKTDDTHWDAVYIGQTDDFSDRLPNHEKWNSALRIGATHIHILVVQQEADRDQIEELLIQHLQPILNQQLR